MHSPTPAAPVTTLAEREAAMAGMRGCARARGGRFVVSGSCAAARFDGGLDVLADFPAQAAGAAWRFVEDPCARPALPPDLRDAATAKPAFVARIAAGGRVLP